MLYKYQLNTWSSEEGDQIIRMKKDAVIFGVICRNLEIYLIIEANSKNEWENRTFSTASRPQKISQLHKAKNYKAVKNIIIWNNLWYIFENINPTPKPTKGK